MIIDIYIDFDTGIESSSRHCQAILGHELLLQAV